LRCRDLSSVKRRKQKRGGEAERIKEGKRMHIHMVSLLLCARLKPESIQRVERSRSKDHMGWQSAGAPRVWRASTTSDRCSDLTTCGCRASASTTWTLCHRFVSEFLRDSELRRIYFWSAARASKGADRGRFSWQRQAFFPNHQIPTLPFNIRLLYKAIC